MTRHPADVILVDPTYPAVPEDLAAPASEQGEVVVLLADEDAHDQGWPGRTAIAIARGWSAAGRRVILADADLAGAGLDGVVGVTDGEGLSDMVLYGASPFRVARRPPGSGFLFVSAGTVVADVGRVYAHPRWSSLLAAFRESGSVLVLYVPSEDEDVGALAAEGDRVYRLTAPSVGGETKVAPETTPPSRTDEALEAVDRTASGVEEVVSEEALAPSADALEAAAPEAEGSGGALELERSVPLEVGEAEEEEGRSTLEEEARDTALEDVGTELPNGPGLVEEVVDVEEAIHLEGAVDLGEDVEEEPLGVEGAVDAEGGLEVEEAVEEAPDAEAAAPPSGLPAALPEPVRAPAPAPFTEEWFEEGEARGQAEPTGVAPEGQGKKDRAVSPLLLVLLLLVVALVLVGAWLGYFTIPGLMSTTGIAVSSPPFALFHPDARSEARG